MAISVSHDFDLSSWNTFRMKVRCGSFVEYDTEEDLAGFLSGLSASDRAGLLHIGGGSNLLFTGDIPGCVLHSRINFIETVTSSSPLRIRVGGGTRWDDVCAWCAERGLWGPENLSLIPGETGAAAVQNIGAYGKEMKDLVESVECIDLQTTRKVVFDGADCRYAYRDSIFKHQFKGRYALTAVVLRVSDGYSPELDYGHVREAVESAFGSSANLTPAQVRETIIGIRQGKLPDPAETGSAGSFFRNPYVTAEQYSHVAAVAEAGSLGPVPHFVVEDGLVKIPAAWLIEKCGWKGYREGNVGVYEHQPLVIINASGHASPGEVLCLEEKIISSVRSRFGITLDPEVEHI